MKRQTSRPEMTVESGEETGKFPTPKNVFEKYQVVFLVLIIEVLIFVLWKTKNIQPLPMWDGTYYIRYSLNSVFPPVYPFFIIMARLIISPDVLAAEVVSIAFSCASVVVVFRLARHFTSPQWALVAAVFTGFNPLSLRLGTETLSEATYLFFILFALYLYAGTVLGNDKPLRLYLSGILLAVAYFTRPEAVVLLVALLIIDWFKRRNFRRVLVIAGGFLTVSILVISGMYIATGDMIITKKTTNFRVMDPTNWVANETKHGTQSFSEIVNSTIQNYPTNFIQEGSNLIKFLGIPAILLALYYLRKGTFLIAGLAEFFVYPLFTGLALPERFVYPYIPVIGILAVAAISNFASKSSRVIFVVLLFGGTLTGLPILTTIQEPFPEQIAAGIALKPFVNDSTIILDRKPYSCFYAGLNPHNNYETIPAFQPIDSVIDYAKRTRASYLVLDRPVIHIFRPQLETLFDPSIRAKYAGKLELFKDIFPDEGYEVLIFKVL